MTGASNSFVVRLARLVWPYRNPLARGVDRLESATLGLVVLAGLLLVPVMLVWGSIVHADMLAAGESQVRTRHAAVATLTEDAPEPDAGGHGNASGGKSMVEAEWRLPDGSTGAGRVTAFNGLDAGAKVDIWLDQDGRVVDRPLGEADAAAAGVVVALAGWLITVLVLVLAQNGLHFLLNHRRYRRWDEQWEQVEPGWNNYRR